MSNSTLSTVQALNTNKVLCVLSSVCTTDKYVYSNKPVKLVVQNNKYLFLVGFKVNYKVGRDVQCIRSWFVDSGIQTDEFAHQGTRGSCKTRTPLLSDGSCC